MYQLGTSLYPVTGKSTEKAHSTLKQQIYLFITCVELNFLKCAVNLLTSGFLYLYIFSQRMRIIYTSKKVRRETGLLLHRLQRQP